MKNNFWFLEMWIIFLAMWIWFLELEMWIGSMALWNMSYSLKSEFDSLKMWIDFCNVNHSSWSHRISNYGATFSSHPYTMWSQSESRAIYKITTWFRFYRLDSSVCMTRSNAINNNISPHHHPFTGIQIIWTWKIPTVSNISIPPCDVQYLYVMRHTPSPCLVLMSKHRISFWENLWTRDWKQARILGSTGEWRGEVGWYRPVQLEWRICEWSVGCIFDPWKGQQRSD